MIRAFDVVLRTRERMHVIGIETVLAAFGNPAPSAGAMPVVGLFAAGPVEHRIQAGPAHIRVAGNGAARPAREPAQRRGARATDMAGPPKRMGPRRARTSGRTVRDGCSRGPLRACIDTTATSEPWSPELADAATFGIGTRLTACAPCPPARGAKGTLQG
ncbi:hypothetical protein [Luteimonas deserti]|uniref:Uncharacterized protein n=1 Tax=Luteimonas deserti TaxID=2752306 RepID=A0A7Z0QT19_9GAMM|nr:hypothetical protein [Luteimonas deserti]NYZ62928.1 hypothetical protein [Luteimonas deserti]